MVAKCAVISLLLARWACAAVPLCNKNVVVPANATNPRNGEGDVAVLSDGRLLLAYSAFMKGAAADDSPAEILACDID